MNTETQFLGEQSPLLSNLHTKVPERRQVSKRWLISSVLVGVTSFSLMGGALLAALEGRQQLATPAQVYQRLDTSSNEISLAQKGNHPGLINKVRSKTSNVMMVSTISNAGNQNVVKVRPFLNVSAAMALAPQATVEYPKFNPLSVFSESGQTELIAKSSDIMYGADVEGEVTLSVTAFPFDEAYPNRKSQQRASDIEKQVRSMSYNLDTDTPLVSALAYFDSERFSFHDQTFLSSPDVVITAENVSSLGKYKPAEYQGVRYEERLIEVLAEASISEIFTAEGLVTKEADLVEKILASDLGTKTLNKGDQLQTYFQIMREEESTGKSLARVSLYRGATHLVSIARSDANQFAYAIPPESTEEILNEAEEQRILANNSLPSIYDGIYRTALSQGLTPELSGILVKIFAFDVDFKTRISAADQLATFISLEDGKEKASSESEILYASITLGGHQRKYYRFSDAETGRVDYYDETGKSAKKFLLRQPVPNGRFRSPFGKRWHPILKYRKMHWGVDWAAPRGTPILAAGNGVIKEAGWSGSGYGKQTIILHANGYETSYAHQTAIAKGIKPGVRVRQGQLIGYVGSTGLSTGPHLHYEVEVNGNRVDPMRIRLPKGKVLKGAELAAFEAERDRIDALVNQEKPQELALN